MAGESGRVYSVLQDLLVPIFIPSAPGQYGFAQGLSKSTKVELCQGLGRMLKAGWCLQSLQHPRTKMSVAGLRVAQEGTQLEERRGQEHGRRNQPVFHHRARCA